jgi:hypothetical protein
LLFPFNSSSNYTGFIYLPADSKHIQIPEISSLSDKNISPALSALRKVTFVSEKIVPPATRDVYDCRDAGGRAIKEKIAEGCTSAVGAWMHRNGELLWRVTFCRDKK